LQESLSLLLSLKNGGAESSRKRALTESVAADNLRSGMILREIFGIEESNAIAQGHC
jgi:hypothetical protein